MPRHNHGDARLNFNFASVNSFRFRRAMRARPLGKWGLPQLWRHGPPGAAPGWQRRQALAGRCSTVL